MTYIPESYSIDPSAMSSTPPQPKVADQIWAEIAKVDTQAYGLPGQTIDKFCTPIPVEPTKLYLKYTNSTIVAFMQEVLSTRYDVDLNGLYITVERKVAK
jgi:hypothetical protein